MGQGRVRHPGSVVLDRDFDHAVRQIPTADSDQVAAVADGVLDQICEYLTQVDLVHEHRRRRRIHVDFDGFGGGLPRSPDNLGNEVVEVARLELGFEGAAFDPAQVQEVANEPAHPFGFGVDGGEGLALVLVRPGHGFVEHASCSRTNRRQWRAQVVRYGIEEGRLEGLAALGDFGISALLGDSVADDCLSELVRGGRKDAGFRSARFALLVRPQGPDGAERFSRGLDSDAVHGGALGLSTRTRRGKVRSNPAGWLISRRSLQDYLPARDGRRSPRRCVGDRPLVRRFGAQPKPDPVHGRRRREPLQHDRRRLLDGPRLRQSSADAE